MESSKKDNFEIVDGKVMLLPVLGMEGREIGEVMEDEQQTVAYFQAKYEVFEKKVDELVAKVQTTDNKGSFLMKVLHLKDQLKELNGLGDFEATNQKLEAVEQDLHKSIAENRHKNLGYKQALLSELESFANALDFTPDSFNQVKEIQQKWIRVGRIAEELEDEYETRFDSAIKVFFSKREEFLEARKLLTEARVEKYKALIAEAKELLAANTFANNGEAFKELQKKWKDVGFVSPKLLNDLWAAFKETGDAFFKALKAEHKKQNPKGGQQRSGAGLKRKKELLEQAKTLYDIDLSEASALAKELQKEWKNSGFVKREEQQELYEEFMLACDFVFEYRFLNTLFEKKIKNASELDEALAIKEKVKLIQNLIRKDKDELSRFEDNSLGMNVVIRGDNSFGKVVDSRLSSQKRKLEAKTLIATQLKSGINKK